MEQNFIVLKVRMHQHIPGIAITVFGSTGSQVECYARIELGGTRSYILNELFDQLKLTTIDPGVFGCDFKFNADGSPILTIGVEPVSDDHPPPWQLVIGSQVLAAFGISVDINNQEGSMTISIPFFGPQSIN